MNPRLLIPLLVATIGMPPMGGGCEVTHEPRVYAPESRRSDPAPWRVKPKRSKAARRCV